MLKLKNYIGASLEARPFKQDMPAQPFDLYFTDTGTRIGARHLANGQPLQDSTIAFIEGDAAVAMVSDGCSTGGNTEQGSKAWLRAAVKALRTHGMGFFDARMEDIEKELLVMARHELLGMEQADGLATLGMAKLTPTTLTAALWGDGLLMAKCSEEVHLWEVQYTENAPFYLSYVLNPDWGLQGWLAQWPNQLRRVVHRCYDLDGNLTAMDVDERPTSQGLGLKLTWEYPIDLEGVALLTDGAVSFDSLSALDLLGGLDNALDIRGPFVQRYIDSIAEHPADDLGIALLWKK